MTQRPEIDPVLLRKYDVRGPRYTSYPTAPQFSADVDEAVYREVAARAGTSGCQSAASLKLFSMFGSSR